jgi:hypothetical protein
MNASGSIPHQQMRCVGHHPDIELRLLLFQQHGALSHRLAVTVTEQEHQRHLDLAEALPHRHSVIPWLPYLMLLGLCNRVLPDAES